MSNCLYILGAGAHAREIALITKRTGAYLKGFVSDDYRSNSKVLDLPVISDIENFPLGLDNSQFIVGVGNIRTKKSFIKRASCRGFQFSNVIDPSVLVLGQVQWGTGVSIFPGVILSDNITIGDHVSINLQSTLSHDVSVGDFCTISPGVRLLGRSYIEDSVFIGAGAAVLPCVRVGYNTTIGAGAVVTKDLPPNCVAVGVPAHPIQEVSK